ncbi:MAG: FHA domain-containing protein [Anaerolineaceae bacterium]
MLALIVLIFRYILMIVLYIFLGWVIYTLWRDLRFQSQIVTAQKIPQLTLAMESDIDGSQKSFVKTEVIIGREVDSDFQVNDEAVSSRHARLTYRYLQWWVEDLQSTNGTFLNEQRVETATVIIKGDELTIGHQNIIINIESFE